MHFKDKTLRNSVPNFTKVFKLQAIFFDFQSFGPGYSESEKLLFTGDTSERQSFTRTSEISL